MMHTLLQSLVLLGLALPSAPLLAASAAPLEEQMEERAFDYFWQTCHTNGLMPVRVGLPNVASIAAGGHLLNALCIGSERGWVKRDEAVTSILNQLDMLDALPRVHGFWAAFYDTESLKPIPYNHPQNTGGDTLATAYLAAGLITAEAYFDGTDEAETTLRTRARKLYTAIEWPWMLPERSRAAPPLLAAFRSPEHGFSEQRLTAAHNISAMTAYILALASPAHALPPETWYAGWCTTYQWINFADSRLIQCPPLAHQEAAHSWLNLSCRADRSADYTRATATAILANRQYAVTELYPESALWGLSDCTGLQGFERYGYPPLTGKVNQDAVLASASVIGALPFTPALARTTLQTMRTMFGEKLWGEYGFYESYSPKKDWFFKGYSSEQQGLVLTMLANRRDGIIQRAFMSNSDIRRAMDQAGFHGIVADFEPAPHPFTPYALLAPSRYYSSSLTAEQPREGRFALNVNYTKGYSADAALQLYPQCRDFSSYRYISCWVNGLKELAMTLTDQTQKTVTLAPPIEGPSDADSWQRLYFELPASATLDLQHIESVGLIAEPNKTRERGEFMIDGIFLVNRITGTQPESPKDLAARAARMPGEVRLSWNNGSAPPYRQHIRYAASSIRNQDEFDRAVAVPDANGLNGSASSLQVGGLATGQDIYFAIQSEDLDGNLSPISRNVRVFLDRHRIPDIFPLESFDEEEPFIAIASSSGSIQNRRVTDVSLEGAGCLEVDYRQTGEADRWAHLIITPDIRNLSPYNYLSMWVAGRCVISLRLVDIYGNMQDTPPQTADKLNSWAPLFFDLSKLDRIDLNAISEILLFIEPDQTDIAGTIYIDSITLNTTRN
jgi:hypothetical protein